MKGIQLETLIVDDSTGSRENFPGDIMNVHAGFNCNLFISRSMSAIFKVQPLLVSQMVVQSLLTTQHVTRTCLRVKTETLVRMKSTYLKRTVRVKA